MSDLIEWVRSVLLLYFLMMIILYLAAGETYKKYIRFFMGLVLILSLLTPILSWTGHLETLQNGIAYETFWQGMEEARLDFSRLEEQEKQVRMAHYEQAVEERFLAEAKECLLDIREISVTLNEAYELEKVQIREGLQGDGAEFRRYLTAVYGLAEGQVEIL